MTFVNHIWFAWFPVFATTQRGKTRLAWLEYVWRDCLVTPQGASKARYYTL